ncbi:hypothetical protein KKC17_03615 [Patescibacteria group bacterium]|nr:hypothetical protein [Patescibacteria group bacterium]
MVSVKQFKARSTVKKRRGHDYARAKHEIPDVNRRLFKAYQTQAKPTWRKRLYYILPGLFIVLVAVIIHLPIFSIKNIIINGVPSQEARNKIRLILNQEIAGRRWLLWPQSNIIFFDTSKARKLVGQEFYSQDLFFKRHWPNVLKLNFRESLMIARWQTKNKVYAVDQRGIIVQELKDQAVLSTNLVLIREVGDKGYNLGDQVIDEQAIAFVDSFNKFWQENLSKIKLDYVLLDLAGLPTVQAYTADGWYVYLSVREDPLGQINSLKRLLAEKIKGDINRLLYVDVRFGARLFYKLK